MDDKMQVGEYMRRMRGMRCVLFRDVSDCMPVTLALSCLGQRPETAAGVATIEVLDTLASHTLLQFARRPVIYHHGRQTRSVKGHCVISLYLVTPLPVRSL